MKRKKRRFDQTQSRRIGRLVIKRFERFDQIKITVDRDFRKTNANVRRCHRSLNVFVDIRIEMNQIGRTSAEERGKSRIRSQVELFHHLVVRLISSKVKGTSAKESAFSSECFE